MKSRANGPVLLFVLIFYSDRADVGVFANILPDQLFVSGIPTKKKIEAYLSVMIIIIWLLATAFAIYMLQRNASRMEKQHERSKERFEKLLEQLKNSGDKSKENLEEKKTTK